MSAIQTIEFDAAVISEPGGRSENQDCAGSQYAGDLFCWVLADGLGGHHGGATAARLAIDGVLKRFVDRPALGTEAVRGYLEIADAAVREGQHENARLKNMRSTLVVLVASRESAVWGHIGDTRLYYFQHGRIAQQTQDHSVPQALVTAGEIRPDQIRFHDDRARLLRSLGAGESFRPSILESPQSLSPGDAFLVCTDGFWEFVPEDQMEADLAAAQTAEDWLARMRARVERAVPPDHDNFSAIAIRIVGQASWPSRPA